MSDTTVTNLLGDAGASPTVSYKGKTWTIGHPTQKAKADLEILVVERAKQNLEDARPALTEEEYAAERKDLSAHIKARTWKTFGELWNALCSGPCGNPLFLLTLMRPHHQDATYQDAETLWLNANADCCDAMAVVVPGFLDQLASEIPAEDAARRQMAAERKAEFIKAVTQQRRTA